MRKKDITNTYNIKKREGKILLTAKLGDRIINCYDKEYSKETLKKWDKKNILLCPVCMKPYRYHHGKVATPYFQHKDRNECLFIYHEPETEEHIQGKIALYEWVKTIDGVEDVMIEGWLPETKQRPDLMFRHNNKQYVIEFQCEPIASEYIERHELYRAAGICDIWILGLRKYKIEIVDNSILYLLTNRCIYDGCTGFFDGILKELFIKNSEHLHYYELKDVGFYNLHLIDTIINFNGGELYANELKRIQVEKVEMNFTILSMKLYIN